MRGVSRIAVLGILALLSVSAVGTVSTMNRSAMAAEDDESAPERSSGAKRRVNVEKLKKQYWREEEEYDVVQNRIYSKANKIHLVVMGGIVDSDPFLDVKAAGGILGYNFNEYVSGNILVWKSFSNSSEALKIFEAEQRASANTNPPSLYYGGEAGFSLIYGKLSLLGRAILYYDLHLLAGLGQTKTETGTYFTQNVGIGQQIYLSRRMALRLDYRLMHYTETIVEKINPVRRGQEIGERTNWTNALTLGLSFLFL